jgi:[acyl-carrier-protein] S-malonyltransferase
MSRPQHRTAFLFAGQGDQFVGMGMALYQSCDPCRRLLEAACAAVDLPLLRLMAEGPAERLAATLAAQPATVAVAVAEADHLAHAGERPDAVLGHSVGHLAALVVAGSLDLPAAMRLAVARARAMQAAVPAGVGAMAAVVGLAADTVEAACRAARPLGEVGVACYNAPGRQVISGRAPAVAAASARCEAAGGATVPLAISIPSHSALMAPAAPALAAALAAETLRPPDRPVLDAATLTYLTDAAAVRRSLLAQLTAPVRFEDCLERLAADGVETWVGCGPGRATLGFVRRTLPGARTRLAADRLAAPLPAGRPA